MLVVMLNDDYIYIFTMVLNLLCNSAFEQGHQESWHYRNAFIIIYYYCLQVGLWIDAGSRYENEKNNGVAHFLEHMAFKVRQNSLQRHCLIALTALSVTQITVQAFRCCCV